MAFKGSDIRSAVSDRVHKNIDQTGTRAYTQATRWIQQGVRYLQGVNDWACHKNEFSLTLANDDYDYAFSASSWPTAALTRPRKLQGDSIRYGSHFLEWKDQVEEIDRLLGPQWKDSATTSATPRYATTYANQLVIAPKPSSAFVTANSLLNGYFFQGEDVTSTNWEDSDLVFYEDLFMPLVDICNIFGMHQEDESALNIMLQRWERLELPNVRGYDFVLHSDEPIEVPDLGIEDYTY
jgi:hypothetical protein